MAGNLRRWRVHTLKKIPSYIFFPSQHFLKIYFIDYATTVVPFPPFIFFRSAWPLPPAFPHLSSRPRVTHITFLASTFPILFFTSPCLFSTYNLCYLFPVPFPLFPFSPSLLINLQVMSISVSLVLFSLFA